MYKIVDVSISGFWQKYKVIGSFSDDVNILIGKNGSGKTTFMNILHAVLAVDITVLFENDFSTVTITLIDGKRKRTIKATKYETERSPFPVVEYQISTRKYTLPIYGSEDIRTMPISVRRRAGEEAQQIRASLSELVSLASLSVYRMGQDADPDARERFPKRAIASPVDTRLQSLMQQLTHYQLELSTQARSISAKLQQDVLTSLLYDEDSSRNTSFNLSFDENVERQNLISAYRQLGVGGASITKRIQVHTAAISKASKQLMTLRDNASDNESDNESEKPIDFAALEAWQITRRVIEMSLEAESKTKEIFSQIDLFLGILKGFISDKVFEFYAGDLRISPSAGVTIERLSSGEKQLLILLIEALLQRQHPFVFLADEPELSLHIAWQRMIIEAIRKLNPNAQIIVATHSPEIAGKFGNKIMDMEDMVRV